MRQLTLGKMTAMAISDDDREFFVQLGGRIADLRKSKNITQIQMAESLGVAQQTFNCYECYFPLSHRKIRPFLAKLRS
jgi:DNA-binding XRE family transcriptional regulator